MALFVTFEGIEGSGKSTHVRELAGHLRAQGRAVCETREPGATAAGAAIRRLLLGGDATPLTPLAELLLYVADRAQHVHEVVRPALGRDEVVLCDRFSDSTVAYQGFARGLDLGLVRDLDARARNGVVPDLTLVLDCPAVDGLARARGRGAAADRFEREAVAFHERVRDAFLTLAAAEPSRFRIVDATRSVAAVQAQVVAEVERRLERRS